MISLFNAVIIVLYLVFAPIYYGVKGLIRLVCTIVAYGVIYPILVMIVLVAYLSIELINLVPLRPWEKS
jgi:hypothetical protein